MELAELVQKVALEERGIEADIELVENPRGNETLTSEFSVATTYARESPDWSLSYSAAESISGLFTE